jgi:hypothetical protein
VLHEQLEKILGMNTFTKDVAFWNGMIDAVEGENIVVFNNLRARYMSTDVSQSLVSKFPHRFLMNL